MAGDVNVANGLAVLTSFDGAFSLWALNFGPGIIAEYVEIFVCLPHHLFTSFPCCFLFYYLKILSQNLCVASLVYFIFHLDFGLRVLIGHKTDSKPLLRKHQDQSLQDARFSPCGRLLAVAGYSTLTVFRVKVTFAESVSVSMSICFMNSLSSIELYCFY